MTGYISASTSAMHRFLVKCGAPDKDAVAVTEVLGSGFIDMGSYFITSHNVPTSKAEKFAANALTVYSNENDRVGFIWTQIIQSLNSESEAVCAVQLLISCLICNAAISGFNSPNSSFDTFYECREHDLVSLFHDIRTIYKEKNIALSEDGFSNETREVLWEELREKIRKVFYGSQAIGERKGQGFFSRLFSS